MEKKYRVTYTNGVNPFSREFTKQQIKDNIHLDEICDTPTLKDYRIESIEKA